MSSRKIVFLRVKGVLRGELDTVRGLGLGWRGWGNAILHPLPPLPQPALAFVCPWGPVLLAL